MIERNGHRILIIEVDNLQSALMEELRRLAFVSPRQSMEPKEHRYVVEEQFRRHRPDNH